MAIPAAVRLVRFLRTQTSSFHHLWLGKLDAVKPAFPDRLIQAQVFHFWRHQVDRWSHWLALALELFAEAGQAAGALRAAGGTAARDSETTARALEPYYAKINALPPTKWAK